MAIDHTQREAAEQIAIAALGFVAADPVLLPRFLAVSGIEPSAIRLAAREPGFLAGVLKFLLDHEPTLLAFAEATETEPAAVARAARALPTGENGFDRQP